MLMLQENLSYGQSCLAHGSKVFSATLVALFLLCCLVIWVGRRDACQTMKDAPQNVASFRTPPMAIYSMAAVAAVLVLTVAFAAGAGRSRNVLFIRDGKIVERGCKQFRPYEESYQLGTTRIFYKYRQHKGKETNEVIFEPTRYSRRLILDLNRTSLDKIRQIAPHVLADYARRLREHNKPLPAGLDGL